jgi:hypothetical protein
MKKAYAQVPMSCREEIADLRRRADAQDGTPMGQLIATRLRQRAGRLAVGATRDNGRVEK